MSNQKIIYRFSFSLLGGALLLVGLFLLLMLNSTPPTAYAWPVTLMPSPTPPATRPPGPAFVKSGGAADGWCLQDAPCGSIQYAIDECTPGNGDTIYVAGGVYTGTGGAVISITKSITLYGGWDGETTGPVVRDPDIYSVTIDGEGARRGVYIAGNITPTLHGLRITRGDAAGLGGYVYYGTYDAGGGVYVITATVTLANNDIFSNTAPYGAGVFLGNSLGTLDHNTILSNTATHGGGGLFAYKGAPTLIGNAIISNTAPINGGGLYLFSTAPSLLYNTIADNSTDVFGGGVSVASCSPIFTANLVIGNEAKKGGGIELWYSHSSLTNNVIADNRATISGSGLWIGGSKPSLLHTTLARNTGGDDSGVLVTVAGTTHSNVFMTNTILVSHTVGISVTAGSTATLEGTLWGSGSWDNDTDWGGAGAIFTGTVNVRSDPAFVNPNGGDYHIGPTSAAVDAGVDAGVSEDIDGDTRPQGSGYDIGADEYAIYEIYLPLVLRNH